MKRWLALVVMICFVGTFLAGCSEAQTVPQNVTEVTRGDLVISVPVSGNLEMPRNMDLSFGTIGTVAEIMVKEGDEVSKGEVLAKLDARSLELSSETAQARVEMAHVGYETAQIEYEIAQNQLMQTIYPYYANTYATDLPGAWLALDEAQSKLEEAQIYIEQGNIKEAHELLEQVDGSLHVIEEKSQARVWSVPFSIKVMELQVEQAKFALNMSKLELDMAKLDLARAKLELAKAIIAAPFGGVIAEVYIEDGQQLSAMTYTGPAICIVDPSEIKMNGVIDEIDISKVKLGKEAIIILDALPSKEVRGKVTLISPVGTIRAGVVSYKATITLENPDEELRDGMSATAEIVIDRRENVLLIPNRAMQGTLAQPWVKVVAEDGRTERRDITVGLSDGIDTEVLSGLKEGEKVVVPQVAQMPFMPFGG